MFKFFKSLNRRRRRDSDPFFIADTGLDKTIGADSHLSWVEESFEDEKSRSHNERLDNPRYLNLIFNWQKLMIIFLAILAGLFLLFLKISYLQVVKGETYHQMAEGNRLRLNNLKSLRGIIYDANLTPLVKNVPSFSLYLSPADLPRDDHQKDLLINELVKITGLSNEEIKNKINESPAYSLQKLILKEDIDYNEAIILTIKSEQLPGVTLEIDTRRQYLTNIASLSHILGYNGKINKAELTYYKDYLFDDRLGKSGLELFYEKILRGQYGREEVEVDALGKNKKLIAKEEQQPGESLVLSLDLALQTQVEKILRQVLAANNKKRGAVVVMSPQNGEILALISWPGYDNNLFAQNIKFEDYQKYLDDPAKPLFSRAISGEYPSGSVFKPIVAAAALQEGIITANTGFNSVGGIQIDKWFFPDWKAGGHGWTNVIKALSESVNTFFYYIGGGDNKDIPYLGVEKIVKYAKMFGLSAETGVDLPNEQPGFLPTMKWKETVKKEPWYIGDTYHLAIGQGDILVTPLQVASYTSTIANGGIYYRPHIVKELINTDGQIVRDIKPEIINQDFIKPEYLNIVKRGLREAVLSGSARYLADLPVAAAGKTGTAEWGVKKSPHAWFTGFAPYDNPQLVVTVLVEEGGEGSAVALPVAKEIMKWYFSK